MPIVYTLEEYAKLKNKKKTINGKTVLSVEENLKRKGMSSNMDDIAPLSPKAQLDNKIQSMMSVTGSTDFGTNSKYISTKSDKFFEKLGSKYGMGYNDLQYEYINNRDGLREEIDRKAAAWGSDSGKTSSSYREKALDYMTDEEIAVYNYYYQTEGKDKAQEFLDAIADNLSSRKAGHDFVGVSGNTAREILYGAVAGTEDFKQGLKNFGNMLTGKSDYIPKTSTQKVSGFIREDLADEGFKVLGNSVGQMGYDVLRTGANMLPTIAAGAAYGPVAGTALMGASAAGGTYQEALNEYGDKDKAKVYASTIGVLEGTLQMALGGIGKLGGLSPVINNAVAGVKDGALRFALEYGGKIGSEALEEGLQEVLDPVVKNAVYGTDEKIDWNNVAYSALLGGMMGGVFGATEVAGTHLNAGEHSFVEKEIENRIREKGDNVSKREQAKIREQVMEDFENGRMDTDTIGSMFTPEAYKQYKESAEKEAAALKEPNEKLGELRAKLKALNTEKKSLKDTPNASAEVDRLIQETKQQIEETENQAAEIRNNSDRLQLQRKMDSEAFEILKNTRFAESYNEKTRRSQDLDVDVESYTNERARRTAQNFKDYGANNSKDAHNFLDLTTKMAERGDHSYRFMTVKQLEESIENGNPYNIKEDASDVEAFVSGTTDEIVIIMDANKSLNSLVGHELTHTLEKAKHYKPMQDFVIKLAKLRGEYDERWESIQRRYSKEKGYTEEQQLQELTADLIGDYVFGETDFIRNLSTENPTIFQKVYNEIKYIWNLATAGSKEKRQLERVKKEFEKVLREGGGQKQEGTTRHSLKIDIKKEISDFGVENKMNDYIGVQKSVIPKLENEGYFGEYVNEETGWSIEITKKGIKETLGSGKRFQYLPRELKELKIATIHNLPQIIQEAHLKEDNVPNKHDEAPQFAYFDIETEINGMPVKVSLDVKKTSAKNKFWIHHIDIIKEDSQLLSSAENQNFNETTNPLSDSITENDKKTSAKNEPVKVLDGGSVTKYSLATWTDDTKTQVKNNLRKAGFEDARVDKWIEDVNGVAATIAADKDRLDYEAADNQTMLKNNQEYVKTLDASTLCAKRLAYQGTFDAIQHRLPNTMLSSDDLIELLNMMKRHGIETPCSVCYVESRRRHLGKFAQEWLNGYDGEYKPSLDEVTTSDGLEKLRHSHPQTYKDFIDAMNKKGSANPKVVQLRTEYRNEIMSLTPAQIRKIDAIGGLRVQSFSDFETPHLLDMMQAVMDMSAKGLTSQAYTKVPNFAWVFGDTGIKINLSLIADGDGFDANGKLAFSSTEGMNIDDAMALRNAYSQNVGTFIVGANDKHILACMADDRIDYIIPFHRSGWGSKELELMGMDSYKDYTYGQNEHNLETGKNVSNLYPPDYWDYSVSGKENAERYLRLCAQTGREPKFSDFLVNNGDGSYSLQPDGSTDGYWKLLIDFKMYDNNGNGAEQQKVQPNFNMTEAYRVLDEYEGGANKLPVANDVVEEFVAKYESNIAPVDARYREIGTARFRLADDDQYTSKEYGEHIYAKDVESAARPEEEITELAKNSEKVANIGPVLSDDDEKRVPGEDLSKKNAEVIRTIKAAIQGHNVTKDITKKEFDEKIARKKSEYQSLKNKDTKKAMDLRNQIVNLENKRDSLIRSYDDKIERANKRIEAIESASRYEKRKTKQTEYRELFGRLMGDTSTWVDKKWGLQYQTNTFRRNLRDVVRDENGKRDIARADAIYDELQGSVNRNEAEKNREANRVKEVFRKMDINDAESTYIQMLGELRHNPDTTLTQEIVDNYYKKNEGKIDTDKVEKAISEARKLYDSLYERVNAILSEHGFKEIGYRKGYFPHFTDPKRNWLARALNWKVNNDEIPTDIAGMTEFFEPQRTWQAFDKHRLTDTTDYNFLKGLDNYVNGALDWVYHIGDIQKHRAFETEIRYRHSSEEVQKKIDEYRNNPMLSIEEVESLIKGLTKEASNPLGNFVTDLHTRTNILAGKKSSKDRNMESDFNRHAYSVMTNLTNRVTANQVVGSVSSAMTNFIPITQSWGQVSPISSLVGMKQTVQSIWADDGVVNKSDFLTNRLAANEALYKGAWDKIGDKVGAMMELVDNFTSQTVWRSKYYENIKKGMSEEQAIKDADQFAENVIGGRSKGNMPTIFHAKNPVTKMLTAFQLEVSNQYGYMLKDMPQDIKENAIWRLTKGYAMMFLGAYAYNELYSALVGRDAAFDPVGIMKEFIQDLADDDDEEKNVANAIGDLASNIADEIPYIGGLLGGGRIPISSALPYDDSIKDLYSDVTEGDWESVWDELKNPLYYAALPMGGGQIRKTAQGIAMFSKKHPVSGSYTKSGRLRFPVEDTLGNIFQAAIFGQYANKNARDYFDNNRNALTEKQIAEYKEVDLPIRDYWEYREGLKGLDTLNEKGDYIMSLDMPVAKKNILINNIASDRKTPIDLSKYTSEYDSFEEFDFAIKYPEKYKVLQEQGISVKDYKDNYQESAFIYTDDYSWAADNPEKYALSKAISDDVRVYKQYASDLNEIKADKDENGKSISGSAKAKKMAYIESLNIDWGQKLLLYRSLYDGKEDRATYDEEVINYLNTRDDLTYDEKVSILIALGFTVDENGNIKW